MKAPVVIVGMGELGGEFAKGFLRCGYPVVPVLRGMSLEQTAGEVPAPVLVVVTVAESDLHAVLAGLPENWRDRVALVQNELTPADWQRHGLDEVTVAVVWFEKKPDRPLTDILFTPIHGSRAMPLIEALGKLGVETRLLTGEDELIFELARKSLYILTLNITALEVDASAGQIWRRHRKLARLVAMEVMQVLELRFARSLPKEALIDAMSEGIDDFPDRPARGRRARQRLERIVGEAMSAGLKVPTLERIARQVQSAPS